jgi:hypothetical protein
MSDMALTEKALFANIFGAFLAEEPERFHSPSKRKILYFQIHNKRKPGNWLSFV